MVLRALHTFFGSILLSRSRSRFTAGTAEPRAKPMEEFARDTPRRVLSTEFRAVPGGPLLARAIGPPSGSARMCGRGGGVLEGCCRLQGDGSVLTDSNGYPFPSGVSPSNSLSSYSGTREIIGIDVVIHDGASLASMDVQIVLGISFHPEGIRLLRGDKDTASGPLLKVCSSGRVSRLHPSDCKDFLLGKTGIEPGVIGSAGLCHDCPYAEGAINGLLNMGCMLSAGGSSSGRSTDSLNFARQSRFVNVKAEACCELAGGGHIGLFAVSISSVKPVELLRRAIAMSSHSGDMLVSEITGWVLDSDSPQCSASSAARARSMG